VAQNIKPYGTVRVSLKTSVASSGYQPQGDRDMLTPSTPAAYPQVVSRRFAHFRVVKFGVSAGQLDFWDWFDSRQLHWE